MMFCFGQQTGVPRRLRMSTRAKRRRRTQELSPKTVEISCVFVPKCGTSVGG